MVVEDAEAARAATARRAAIDVTEVDSQPWGDFVYIQDPDGNAWALQAMSKPE